ncbi:D-arabinono-1,4-lactone oxidase [Xylariaceae sp. AK1471]|nr:D-arabinono-1,4-lactone oxidase [Xylariaceae sp. AK1471]
MDPLIVHELAKCDDSIPFNAKLHHVHSTWAKTFLSRPDLYFQPETLPEIEKIVRLAHRCHRRITTTGCGHSPSSLTCTSSWLVNLDKYNRILSLDKSTGIVVMQSGIRLYQLCDELAKHGFAMPNLGSINQQSIAGAISTGTHGSSLSHGIMSEDVLSLRITTADGVTRFCSPDEDPELFRAALLSLGALGIITEVTFQSVPEFALKWQQVIDTDVKMLNSWDKGLWTQAEFVRVWWYPYTRRAVVWSAQKTFEPLVDPPRSYYGGSLGYYIYHNLLYVAQYVPRILPWVEWFVFGMEFGFSNGSKTQAIQPSRQALLMNCLYSQYVDEWAIPLHKGPEALRRLSSWLNQLPPTDPGYVPHNIPFSAKDLWVHAPVEVRVSDSSPANPKASTPNSRPYLDPTFEDGPTLYLNATLYRPYHRDPPCHVRYYEAFEWLMRDLGGRPHWAKNFETAGEYIEKIYGSKIQEWRKVRERADPDGVFVGHWHRRNVLGSGNTLLHEEIDIGSTKVSNKAIHFRGAILTGSDVSR